MSTFIRKAALFIAIQLVIVFVVVSLAKPDATGWMSAGVDKRSRLRTAPAPRIVFIGGSSVCFGIDSEQIPTELGLNPVNMGLHAGLGMDFILEEAKLGLRSNDVLVVSFEYDHFLKDETQWGLLAQVARTEPLLVARLKPFDMLDHGYRELLWESIYDCLRLQGADRSEGNKVYVRSAFNAFGDAAYWKGGSALKPHDMAKTSEVPPPYFYKSIDKLARFQEWCQRRGVVVFWAYPPIADFAFQPVLASQVRDELTKRVPMPQLNRPEDAIYPVRLFGDTQYHLNREGAVLRTRQIISRLKPWLSTMTQGTNSVSLSPKHR